jgi:D-alanyl-D-alanine carboxypeptidase (penicillin-binding protein 5/6)
VSEEAGNMIGTTATLKPFDFVSLRDLLYGLMLPSGNDAAVCLAENVGTHMYLSSEEYRAKKRQPYYDDSRDVKLLNPEKLFYDEMNKFAEKIGMNFTNYANPHGLNNPNNYSCAYDKCKLSLFALMDPLFNQVVRTKSYTSVVERDHREVEITWTNTNKL